MWRRGNPMKMLDLCLAHDPPKRGRFGDQISLPNIGARSAANRFPLLLIALRAERQAEGTTYEY
jgi:hypothetical protein